MATEAAEKAAAKQAAEESAVQAKKAAEEAAAKKLAVPKPRRKPVMNYTTDMYAMCSQCLWNTKETTIMMKTGQPFSVFVTTGDIGDMWIRDSAAQVHPYVYLAKENPDLMELVKGVVKTQAFFTLHDPYSNSYTDFWREKSSLSGHFQSLRRGGYVATGNYEMDSGCYMFRLMYEVWKVAGADAFLVAEQDLLRKAAHAMLDVWKVEQNHERDSPYRYPELARDGKGTLTNYTGMSWTGFRPSDDACLYGYLVPSNIFAIKALAELVEIATDLWSDGQLADKARSLRRDYVKGVDQFGTFDHPTHGRVYCYEVDGLGNCNLMDDANIPSLLSLPYLDPTGTSFDAQVYANTRKLILSSINPYYFTGRAAHGIGSAHTPNRYVWPMAIIMEAITEPDDKHFEEMVQMVVATAAGNRFMHEGFDVDNPGTFSRPWFAWANSLFAELMFVATGKWCDQRNPLPAGSDPRMGGMLSMQGWWLAERGQGR